jgi:transcriptional regulator with XRE-family HTH domain
VSDRRTKKTLTAEALGEILAGRNVSQARVASAAGFSQPYVNQIATGKRLPPADWIDTVANALGLSPKERERLHRAAAKDHGFKIDLTKR